MHVESSIKYQRSICLLTVGAMAVLLVACNSAPKFPLKNTKAYTDVVSAFYVGLSALQVGDDVHAENKLAEVAQLVPGEPAGWANWGILALRQRDYDKAAQRFQKARELAPKNDQIYSLLGLMESQRGNSAQALEDLRKAVELNPNNLRATYQLAEETERQGAANSEAEFEQLIQKILKTQPNNLATLLELSRIAAKRGDAEIVKSAVARINAQASSWPPEVQHQMTLVQTALSSGDLRSAATQTTFLRNVLMRVPDYRLSLRAIKAAPGDEAEPFTRFLLMEAPEFRPAPADTSLKFDAQSATDQMDVTWSWIGAIPLGSTGLPVVAVANSKEVRFTNGVKMPFPGSGPMPAGA